MVDGDGGSSVATPVMSMNAKQFGDFLSIVKEDREKTWAEYQKINDIVQKQEATRAQVETKMIDLQTKLDKRMDAIELLIQAPRQGVGATDKSTEIEEFWGKEGYMRKGIVGPSMAKALSVGDNTLGGYTAPPVWVNELLEGITEYSPVRDIARKITISGSIAQVPKKTSASTAHWLGTEVGTDMTAASGMAFGLETIPLHNMVYELPLSKQLVNDSAFNLDAIIRQDYEISFGVLEGAAFISGTGVGKPEGILTKSGLTSVNSGHASLLTPDGILDLAAALKDGYARNATWLMRRATRYAIRKFKTGTGAYTEPLYIPATATEGPIIEGRPIVECPDMPAVAGSAYPIAFGDFQRGYTIVDNTNMMFLRDELTLAKKLQIDYVGARAVGGQVTDTDAIVKQYVSA